MVKIRTIVIYPDRYIDKVYVFGVRIKKQTVYRSDYKTYMKLDTTGERPMLVCDGLLNIELEKRGKSFIFSDKGMCDFKRFFDSTSDFGKDTTIDLYIDSDFVGELNEIPSLPNNVSFTPLGGDINRSLYSINVLKSGCM